MGIHLLKMGIDRKMKVKEPMNRMGGVHAIPTKLLSTNTCDCHDGQPPLL